MHMYMRMCHTCGAFWRGCPRVRYIPAGRTSRGIGGRVRGGGVGVSGLVRAQNERPPARIRGSGSFRRFQGVWKLLKLAEGGVGGLGAGRARKGAAAEVECPPPGGPNEMWRVGQRGDLHGGERRRGVVGAGALEGSGALQRVPVARGARDEQRGVALAAMQPSGDGCMRGHGRLSSVGALLVEDDDVNEV